MSAQSSSAAKAAAAAAATASGHAFPPLLPPHPLTATSTAVSSSAQPALAQTGAALATSGQGAEKGMKSTMAEVGVQKRAAAAAAASDKMEMEVEDAIPSVAVREVSVGKSQVAFVQPGMNIKLVIDNVFNSYVLAAEFYDEFGDFMCLGVNHHDTLGHREDMNGFYDLFHFADFDYTSARISIYASTFRAEEISSVIQKWMTVNPGYTIGEQLLNPFGITLETTQMYGEELNKLNLRFKVLVSSEGDVTVQSTRPLTQKIEMSELMSLAFIKKMKVPNQANANASKLASATAIRANA